MLVVDDVDEMRMLIRRALGDSGYAVDIAATLAEARGLRPSRYDAVLVDAHIGQERGLDLIDELRSDDPAAAGRCLVMSGGPAEALPDGVGRLDKPFRLDELVEAVRALRQREGDRAAGRQAAVARHLDQCPPAAGQPRGHNLAAGAQASRLLGLTRAVRARERHELIDFLHDGPIQELTAAALALELMSRSMVPGQAKAIDSVLQRLDSVSSSLRWLLDGQRPFAAPQTQLAAALKQRTTWLLAAAPTVDTEEHAADLNAVDVPVIVDAVELILFALVECSQPATAAVAVRTEERLIRVELTLTAAAGDGQPLASAAPMRAELDELASAMDATAQVTLSDQQWRVALVLRRPSYSAPACENLADAASRQPGRQT